MDVDSVRIAINPTKSSGFDVFERRPGHYQIILPIFHEDGDMLDVYLIAGPQGAGNIRVCDFGLTLMRLSYTYDIDSDAKRRIFDGILHNNNVGNDNGILYIDTTIEMLYQDILRFAGCVQKVCNMRYWSRETVRNAFYQDLENYTTTELREFNPIPDMSPIPEYELITVDWTLEYNERSLYVFGVRGNDKAKNVAIALLEFQKARLPFISIVVHEDMEDLGRRERLHLTRNADTQYPALNDYKQRAAADISRLAGVAMQRLSA